MAEAGVNHNGSLVLAKKLVDAAAAAGADAVKFQTFLTENVIAEHAGKAAYQKRTTGADESQYEMVRKLQLSFADFEVLAAHARRRGVLFMSTPFDQESVDFLRRLRMKVFKIPSGEVTNLPYLRHVGSLRKEIFISVGMATLQEIGAALGVLKASGTPLSKITVLQANTAYPTPLKDANLRAMTAMARRFGCRTGYSDHTLGLEASLAAAALGAAVIEKHFTLDKSMTGPDHSMSLDPRELADWVRGIRRVESALGSALKAVTPSERPNVRVARRSIVAKRPIKAGERFSPENLAAKRPGTGMSPMSWDSVIGRRAHRDFKKDDLIRVSA